MKTTIDIPDDLAGEVKRLAERSGRDTDEQLVRLVYLALLIEDLPLGELEYVVRRLSAIRAIRNKVVHARPDQPLDSPAISTDPTTGLPVIHSPPDAPIHRMSIDEILALEQSILEEEDLKRAGLPL